MKLTNLTKKLLCGGIVCCSLATSTIASASTITCTSGKLEVKSYHTTNSQTVAYYYPGESFYSNTIVKTGEGMWFEYKAYSGKFRYVRCIGQPGTFKVK